MQRHQTVSICIPTFNRPDYLKEAIESCYRQEHRPLEILIGDDSDNDQTMDLVHGLVPPHGILIRYERNTLLRGQSRNVNRLFERASGDYLVLLHDDDLLCAGGLDNLLGALTDHPEAICVYGLQYVIEPHGRTLDARSVAWNERDRRTTDHSGPQASSLRAALWQHVPNDGFLMKSSVARQVRYRDEATVGHAVDADFIIEVGKISDPEAFVLVGDHVSKYRLTPSSLARSSEINRSQDLFFQSLLADPGLVAECDARDGLLRRIAVGAALDAALARRRSAALKIIFSQFYEKPMFSRWTFYRLLCIVSASAGQFLRKMIRRDDE